MGRREEEEGTLVTVSPGGAAETDRPGTCPGPLESHQLEPAPGRL